MSTNHREMLKNIRTFPSLVKYLRDELDWPKIRVRLPVSQAPRVIGAAACAGRSDRAQEEGGRYGNR